MPFRRRKRRRGMAGFLFFQSLMSMTGPFNVQYRLYRCAAANARVVFAFHAGATLAPSKGRLIR
jgi:hypothetical protein